MPPQCFQVRMTDKMNSKSKNNFLSDTQETRAMKRERNRLAARRCRQKQKDRIDYLEKVRQTTMDIVYKHIWQGEFCG